MASRYAALVRTGQCVDLVPTRFEEWFALARELCPDGFPADETRVLAPLRAHLTLAVLDSLRASLAETLAVGEELFSLDRFSVQGCGPVSLHDDKRNYPDFFFVIVVAHCGRLGLADATSRAASHAPGEIVLIDPHKKHAVVPQGARGADQRCAPPDTLATAAEDQFLFFDFEVPRRKLRHLFARK
jgi:hypothetical protein